MPLLSPASTTRRGAAEAHGDRDLDQGVLAGVQARDRLLLVQVARRRQDHDVDLRVRQSFVERYRPFAVAVALGELPGALGIAADDGVQNSVGLLQRLGVPDAHHAVADHADIHRHCFLNPCLQVFLPVDQRIVGMMKSAPARMPVGQRDGDRLQLGVEADTLGTMHVVVAEQRGLPAAEAVERHRHRDRHVDADHADLDLVRELARRVAVAGEDGGAVAVFVLVDHAGRRLVVRRTHDRQHRAEDLLLIDRHVGGDVVEQRAAQEVAVLVALHLEAASVDHELGALALALVDVAAHLGEVLRRDQRTHLRFGIGAGTDLQAADLRLQLLDQGVGGLLSHRHRDRDRHAALAGGAVGGAHQRIHRLIHVGVGHDDHVVLGAAQRLAALAVEGGGLIDVAGDRGRADEADGRDVGVAQDRVHRRLVAVDDA